MEKAACKHPPFHLGFAPGHNRLCLLCGALVPFVHYTANAPMNLPVSRDADGFPADWDLRETRSFVPD